MLQKWRTYLLARSPALGLQSDPYNNHENKIGDVSDLLVSSL
jgi:hypothetical protein